MRSLIKLICVLVLGIATAGCGSTGMQDSSVDVMFRRTEAVTEGLLELTTPALVNELNGAFEITGIGYRGGAKLSPSGEVQGGDNRVFILGFTDLGDISVLRTDDKRVSLRAEFGADGKVVNALLGSTSGAVSDAFVSSGNDEFESGTYEILYDGPDWVVGRFDLKFRKYRVAGNFRAPRLK